MNNIFVNTQSSIKLILNKVLYFDPYKIEDITNDADIIFITHPHYDHFDMDSINKVKNDNTIIVCPKSLESDISKIKFKDYIYLNPFEEVNVEGISIKAVPAYNTNKEYHKKESNWLGYLVTYNDKIYYIAGDTDKTVDNENIKCDIAFLPIGGKFTMDVVDAANLARKINAKTVIPIHYGTIVGDQNLGLSLKDLLINYDIEVIEKINFK